MAYLKRRHRRWYWRLKIPEHLRHYYGEAATELVRTTGTDDYRRAEQVALKWTAEAKAQFAALDKGEQVRPETLTRIGYEVMWSDFKRMVSLIGSSTSTQDHEIAVEQELDAWRPFVDPGYELPASAETVAEVLAIARKHGVPMLDSSPMFEQFAWKIATAKMEAARKSLQVADGNRSAVPNAQLAEAGENNPSSAVMPFSPSNAGGGQGQLVSSLWDRWFVENDAKWGGSTKADYRTARSVFLDVLGDRLVSEVTRGQVRELRDLLVQLPADWRTPGRYKQQAGAHKKGDRLSAREIVALDPPGPYLKPGTINRYLQAVSGMLKFAVDEDLIQSNPVSNIRVSDPEPPQHKRNMWSTEELNVWLASRWYEEPQGEWDHRQWLPLLGLFTGARLGELARLTVTDVAKVDGVSVLDIRWREGESLKTKSAERVIPLHSELLRLGFLDYVERTLSEPKRSDAGKRLWPNLKRPADGKWGSSFSKLFTRERRVAGVNRDKVDFHSLRSTFITALMSSGVPSDRVKLIAGHSVAKDTTLASYRKAINVKLLKGDVDCVSYAGLRLPAFRSRSPG